MTARWNVYIAHVCYCIIARAFCVVWVLEVNCIVVQMFAGKCISKMLFSFQSRHV